MGAETADGAALKSSRDCVRAVRQQFAKASGIAAMQASLVNREKFFKGNLRNLVGASGVLF
jgi:hypothetical protein